MQSVFATRCFGSDKKLEKRFMLQEANGRGEERFWVYKVLLLFRLEANHNSGNIEEKFAFVQNVFCIVQLVRNR